MIIASGFAVAIAAAPAVAIFAAPAAIPSSPLAACPAGENNDLYTDECVPELVPNQPGGVSYSTPGDSSSLPEISGIPITGHNSGQAIGLEEEQANIPDVVPAATISSSP